MNPYAPKRLAVALVGVLAPLIMAVSVAIANEAQTVFHMELSGPALAAYISAFLIAVGATLFRLLEHEASRFLRDLVKLFASPPAPGKTETPASSKTPLEPAPSAAPPTAPAPPAAAVPPGTP